MMTKVYITKESKLAFLSNERPTQLEFYTTNSKLNSCILSTLYHILDADTSNIIVSYISTSTLQLDISNEDEDSDTLVDLKEDDCVAACSYDCVYGSVIKSNSYPEYCTMSDDSMNSFMHDYFGYSYLKQFKYTQRFVKHSKDSEAYVVSDMHRFGVICVAMHIVAQLDTKLQKLKCSAVIST
jgi:hypothetical protein